ncbi:MAG: NAD(P)H-hydrate epimerase [Candidatus Methylomirabilis sp.]|nr:NAD(P)H-hydrate epimerase [Candidatus Methylomirabilis sp.]
MAVNVVTAEQMRQLDRRATEEYAIPSLLLMENAGLQAVLELERAFPHLSHRRIAVVSGKGNNGGDGFVVARHLVNRGFAVDVVLLARSSEIRGDARTNLDIIRTLDMPIHEVTSSQELEAGRGTIERADLVVDAILGTGTTGPAKGIFGEAIELLNRSGRPIVALDIPSGLNSDEGGHPWSEHSCALDRHLWPAEAGAYPLSRSRLRRSGGDGQYRSASAAAHRSTA